LYPYIRKKLIENNDDINIRKGIAIDKRLIEERGKYLE
jgi:hypothetical protein